MLLNQQKCKNDIKPDKYFMFLNKSRLYITNWATFTLKIPIKLACFYLVKLHSCSPDSLIFLNKDPKRF